jgi:hypothetical protein
MVKHFAFWIGFFAAALMIVPVALGIWGAADELARNIAAFMFGAIAILVLLMVVLLFLRDWLLQRLIGQSEVTLDEIVSSLVKGISAASRGDREESEREAEKLARAATGWYVWSNFYRWVVASALGLLLAFGAFTGTVLLFEQNRKLDQQTALMDTQSGLMEAQTTRMAEQSEQAAMQNEIMTLSLVSELREQLLGTVETISFGSALAQSPGAEWGVLGSYSPDRDTCVVTTDTEAELRTLPSEATMKAIGQLTAEGLIADRVIAALRFLQEDRDPAVSLAALIILDRAGVVEDTTAIFSGLFVDQLRLTGRHKIDFSGSFLASMECPSCDVAFRASAIGEVASDSKLRLTGTLVLQGTADTSGYSFDWAPSAIVLQSDEVPPENALRPDGSNEYVVFNVGGVGAVPAFLAGGFNSSQCHALEFLARENPLLRDNQS